MAANSTVHPQEEGNTSCPVTSLRHRRGSQSCTNWWRLSWEQGKRGERTDPPEGHDETSRVPTLPQGKLPGQTCALMYTCTGTADIEALVTPRVHLSCVKKWASGANVHSCLRTAVRLLQQVFTLVACNAAVQVQVQVKGANFSLDPVSYTHLTLPTIYSV